MIIEIKKPSNPKTKIPIADTFEINSISFLVGFFSACQTRLHFVKNDLAEVNIFAMAKRELRGF